MCVMLFDKYLNLILENLVDQSGIDRIKNAIKDEMNRNGVNYDDTKVECQVFDENTNCTPRIEITSEGYSDGEVIFIDYHLD